MSDRRVVVCGMGMVTPLGWDVNSTWDKIITGQSGIRKSSLLDLEKFGIKSKVAGEIKDWNSPESPRKEIHPKRLKKLDRYAEFGYSAAMEEAIKKSGLDYKKLTFEEQLRSGVIVGTGGAGLHSRERALLSTYKLAEAKENEEIFKKINEKLESHLQSNSVLYSELRSQLEELRKNTLGDYKKNDMSIFQVIKDMDNSLSSQLSMDMNFHGTSFSLGTACSSGADAIGTAYNYIKIGIADLILAVGAESCMTPYNIKGFDLMKALTARECNPEEASCPFDRKRDGFVFAEGAGALILCTLDFAKKYDLQIFAEMAGYANTNDAFHEAMPGDMQNVCMKLALINAGIEKVDYINAHGTSTPKNDPHETAEIKKVFGENAKEIPISSTKSMTGHGIGATGAWEAIFSILAIQNGIIPPTINLNDPDPECDLDYVPNIAREANIAYAMSNSFGFGGQNAVLVFKKFK